MLQQKQLGRGATGSPVDGTAAGKKFVFALVSRKPWCLLQGGSVLRIRSRVSLQYPTYKLPCLSHDLSSSPRRGWWGWGAAALSAWQERSRVGVLGVMNPPPAAPRWPLHGGGLAPSLEMCGSLCLQLRSPLRLHVQHGPRKTLAQWVALQVKYMITGE